MPKDPRLVTLKPFFFSKRHKTLLQQIEGGVPIETLNVGSMAHSTGKTMLNKVLSMDKDDVATFEKLRDLGVKIRRT